LGAIALLAGNYDTAHSLVEQRLTIGREFDSKLSIVISLNWLGHIALAQGNHQVAARLYRESLILSERMGNKASVAGCLDGLATILGDWGRIEQAVQLFGASDLLLPPVDEPLIAKADPLRQSRPREVETLRAQLGEEAFAAAWAEGRAMTLEQAVEYALQETDRPAQSPAPPAPDDLSGREREVLWLLATGLSNKEIAHRLSLSTFTIQAHLRSIYGKLGVSSRSAATRYALEHQLV